MGFFWRNEIIEGGESRRVMIGKREDKSLRNRGGDSHRRRMGRTVDVREGASSFGRSVEFVWTWMAVGSFWF